ncbi:Trk K+ transport system NAD-binding subunit [Jatrophihabitans sp. GAS493]|uniref:NAD-binding protein n=1 Tax=Jatrophihabitans sp. GAS493 TaxID=1907575 RepID=UPI000BB69785|nr:NAD-binding protein [Jatrophihabitans sp. GAS493]SOD71947.1 Trk K+ transport system NAD-binding subunit [Jatrophihabitans sp. GAS493]
MSAPAVPPPTTGEQEQWSGHTIVCGLHDVGLRVIEQLQAAGEQVIVVDDGASARLARIVDSLGVRRMTGDTRRMTTLRLAGVETAAALICAEEGDLHNLGVALLAREMRPDMRLVVSLTNAAVGRAVQRLTGPGTVLDVAELAAPTFVESCVRRQHHVLNLGGKEFIVAHRRVSVPGKLRAIFGDLAPIAVVPQADDAEMLICPGRDVHADPGDVVTLIGPAEEFEDLRATAGGDDSLPASHRIRSAFRQARSVTGGFLAETERSLWATLLALFGVAVVSILLLMGSYQSEEGSRPHMGLVDSAYFTTETLTTVGFGDFSFAHQRLWLRLWAIALMIIGATLVTVVYAMLTNLLISRRIEATAGRRAASGLSDHVVLIGLGSVGMRVLEGLLAEGRDVVVLERDENNRFLAAARSTGVPIIIGDSTIPQNLMAANLPGASAVAVLTSNDLANIETGLAVDDLLAERSADVPVVLRVFDRQLARTIERGFGFQHVRSTSALAAPWFVGAALGLDVLNTFYVDRQPFLVGRLTVAVGGGLAGATMHELSARTRVIAISRLGGAMEYPPRRDTRFEPGDQAYLVGPYEELLQVLRRDQNG